MIDRGKRPVLGVLLDAVNYDAAVAKIIAAAQAGLPFGVSALAVHGVMTGALDKTHRSRLNQLELVVPDGQPVRWALNLLHRTHLRERVYGPALTLRVCQQAAAAQIPIYLYGSKPAVLDALVRQLTQRFPALLIAGMQPSQFRQIDAAAKQHIITEIRSSGAQLVLLGLGCPRQEVWAYEFRRALSMPVLAVGAAFDYHAGLLRQPPAWLQRHGLEWAFRLCSEPRRLWRRYLLLNPYYVLLVGLQLAHIASLAVSRDEVADDVFNYG